jgi:hypothetical protein
VTPFVCAYKTHLVFFNLYVKLYDQRCDFGLKLFNYYLNYELNALKIGAIQEVSAIYVNLGLVVSKS